MKDLLPASCMRTPLKVFDAALEAAVRWCAAGADDKHDANDDTGLPRETKQPLTSTGFKVSVKNFPAMRYGFSPS